MGYWGDLKDDDEGMAPPDRNSPPKRTVPAQSAQPFPGLDDPELATLREGVRLLQALDHDARERVLRYLRRRFIDEATE